METDDYVMPDEAHAAFLMCVREGLKQKSKTNERNSTSNSQKVIHILSASEKKKKKIFTLYFIGKKHDTTKMFS